MLGAIEGDLCKIGWRRGEDSLGRIVDGPKSPQDGFVGVCEAREEVGSERWLDVWSIGAILVLGRKWRVGVVVVNVVSSCCVSVL